MIKLDDRKIFTGPTTSPALDKTVYDTNADVVWYGIVEFNVPLDTV